MANDSHIDILINGVRSWNTWRAQNGDIEPDLSNANLTNPFEEDPDLSGVNFSRTDLTGVVLTGINLKKANFRGADLSDADLSGTNLRNTDMREAFLRKTDLSEADLGSSNLIGADLCDANLMDSKLIKAKLIRATLWRANFAEADLSGADLSDADLRAAELSGADLSGAILRGANLELARLVETNLTRTILTGCRVYGLSAWGVNLENVIEQNDIRVTPEDEPAVTTDNLEMAQFIYLMINNVKIRNIIDTITSKVVLILGRFTPERKAILDAIKKELRNNNYVPVLFDFEKPTNRSLTETVSILAHMARFVIADITDSKSIPLELERTIKNLPHVPFQPLLLKGDSGFAMFDEYRLYSWVLPPFVYDNEEILLASLKNKVIAPAEAKARDQTAK